MSGVLQYLLLGSVQETFSALQRFPPIADCTMKQRQAAEGGAAVSILQPEPREPSGRNIVQAHRAASTAAKLIKPMHSSANKQSEI